MSLDEREFGELGLNEALTRLRERIATPSIGSPVVSMAEVDVDGRGPAGALFRAEIAFCEQDARSTKTASPMTRVAALR